MNVDYTPTGVCSKRIEFAIEDGKIHGLKFTGGCPGNLPAIAKLVEGADAEKIAELFRGHPCASRGTSCADQLARAIDEALGKKAS